MMSPQKNVRRTTMVALVALLTLATVATGCQRARLGARCKTADFGDDGGAWVLKCSNGRWVRALTKADAARIILAANTPPTTAPPTTAAPAAPTAPAPLPRYIFGEIEHVAVGTGGGQIPPGLYMTNATAACGIQRTDASGTVVGDRILSSGPLFFDITAGEGYITTGGDCTWSLASQWPQPVGGDGNGVYRVGIEIQPGRYYFDNALNTNCYWELANSADGTIDAVTDISLSTGPQMIEILPTDKVLVSSRCGTWTPMPTLPAKFLEIVGHPSDPIMLGHRHFSQGSHVTASAATDSVNTYDTVTAAGDGWSVTARSPQGTLFTNTTLGISGAWSTSNPGLTVTGPNGTCAVAPSAITVSNVHRTAGILDGVDLVYANRCGSSTLTSFGRIHIAP